MGSSKKNDAANGIDNVLVIGLTTCKVDSLIFNVDCKRDGRMGMTNLLYDYSAQ
jgi:hypothetical protein